VSPPKPSTKTTTSTTTPTVFVTAPAKLENNKRDKAACTTRTVIVTAPPVTTTIIEGEHAGGDITIDCTTRTVVVTAAPVTITVGAASESMVPRDAQRRCQVGCPKLMERCLSKGKPDFCREFVCKANGVSVSHVLL